ncbi:hypothetical protein GCM10018793_45060 [Streptomyces sulfonofaciens]|uniref:Uncharacterized protein n=1 Tax=Streptomyces sulfonofaciens TaxID=68272 RepID=A0A919L5E6_9ACTN|nr:hypothetical protein [Streptomyces sulfonofaciens]GHH83321.1 hypothetical protein GCM10018793_45060 [Streptomyces sulfonofaciens]
MRQTDGPRHLLVRALGEATCFFLPAAPGWPDDLDTFSRALPPDDPSLGLPAALVGAFDAWLRARPEGGFARRTELRAHARRGLALAQSLAVRLGPRQVVHYWDEAYDATKVVCWTCRRLHWSLEEHGSPPPPVRTTVKAEFKWYPLRSEEFEDFAPDDPAALLHLSDGLVSDLYRWAKDFDAGMEQYLADRDEADDDARRAALDVRGQELAARVTRELGPAGEVTYGGLA